MSWIAVGSTAVKVVGGLISSGSQKSAANQATNDEVQAGQNILNYNSGIYNADAGLTSSSRQLGGLAQSQLAYDLGLSPNLNINSDLETPQVNSSGSVTYNNASGQPISSGSTLPTNAGGTGMSTIQQANNAVSGTTQGAQGTANGGITQGTGVGPASTNVRSASGGSVAQPGAMAVDPATGSSGGGYGSLGNPLSASTFQQDPAYQFNLQQGQLALERQQAAGGTQMSGSALKDAINYASGMASNEYQNEFNNSLNSQAQKFNMLNSVAGNVNTANSQLINAGNNATQTAASAYTNMGNAQANGAVANGNANSSLANTVTNAGTGLISSIGGKLTGNTTTTNPTTTSSGNGSLSALNDPSSFYNPSTIQPVQQSVNPFTS